MSKEKEINIYKLLLKNNRVNHYTKMIILLNTLNYYGDNYIPNKKLMKMLNIDKRRCKRILHQIQEDKIIYIVYKGRKRFFSFRINEEKEKNYNEKIQLYDYNWLEDEDY